MLKGLTQRLYDHLKALLQPHQVTDDILENNMMSQFANALKLLYISIYIEVSLMFTDCIAGDSDVYDIVCR